MIAAFPAMTGTHWNIALLAVTKKIINHQSKIKNQKF